MNRIMDAEQQFQAAAQLYQSDDFPGAEAQLEELAREVPGNPNVLHLLSLARLRQNKSDAAAESLKELTEVAPDSAEAHDLLGCALRQSGRINAAIRHFQRALAIAPDAAHVHYNLGNAYRDDRQIGQALNHYAQSVRLDPENLNAFFNLGQAYLAQSDFTSAVAAFRQVTAKSPQDVEALGLLSHAAFQGKQYALARTALEDALRLVPDNEDFQFLYARTVANLRDFDTATKTFEKLLSSHPGDIELLCALGAIHRAQGDAESALGFYQRAVTADPGSAENQAELGRLLERMNRLDDAWAAIRPGLDKNPNDPALNLVAARLERRADAQDKALARLTGLDPRALADSAAQGEIHFELGFLYDHLGRPGDAIESFENGNAFLARDVQAVEIFQTQSREYLERLKKAFDTGPKPSIPAPGNSDDNAPVFLVGFPRSGTTLLDQVMDAHPGVQVLEEQATLSEVRDRLILQFGDFPANLFDLPDEALAEARRIYFEAVERAIKRDPSARLIDKLPLNILDAGLIHRMFPTAKFIFALRHPFDVCLSCFMQPFDLNPGMVHFTTLEGTAGFYEEVMNLWRIQREALGLNVHEVRYEDLLNDLDGVARGLLEFLDVPWDERVLDPVGHARGQKFIGTTSYHQVVQDLNTKAMDRWRKYELHLAPHSARLKPFISAFGYDT